MEIDRYCNDCLGYYSYDVDETDQRLDSPVTRMDVSIFGKKIKSEREAPRWIM